MAFGDQLRRAREKAGLSLDEVSARTKVRVSVLDAIERADLARLPAVFYTKAFLRAYAAEVHLDVEPIVREYAALVETPLPAPPRTEPSPDQNTSPGITELLGRIRPRLAPAGTFALAGVLLFVVYNLRDANPRAGASGAEPGAVATSGTAPVTAAPIQSRNESIVMASLQPELLTVAIRPSGLLWLEGTADGRRVVSRLLQPDENVVVEGYDSIKLLIGDAAVFDFSINGRPGRPLGRPGEVRTIELNRDNYREFLSAPSE